MAAAAAKPRRTSLPRLLNLAGARPCGKPGGAAEEVQSARNVYGRDDDSMSPIAKGLEPARPAQSANRAPPSIGSC